MKRISILILFVLLFAVALPVLAQAEPVDPLPETPPIAPEDTSTVISFDQLLLLISESVAGSMLVTVLVNAFKRFDPNINPQTVVTVLSLVIVGLVWGARATGQVDLLESVFGWLSVIVPAGVNFLMLLLGAPAVYEVGKALNAPVLGYSPPKAQRYADLRHPEAHG
jgi:hypothetical protein